MSTILTGRDEEQKVLDRCFDSKRPEFLAIYGRRRVGKSFLIQTFFEDKKALFLSVTGAKDGSLKEQIKHFTKEIGKTFYSGAKLAVGKNWDDTFEALTEAIESVPKNKKIVLFYDEFPWMATKNSGLLQNLAYYWNQYWSKDKRIKLIICGSSASWILEKIVNNKGGLHNRITRKINLKPFNLRETKQFLHNAGIKLKPQQILQIYMVTGGVPYYLTHIEKGLSSTQIIEQLAFRKNSFLLEEFDNLFASLFNDSEIYIKMVRIMAQHKYGIGQEALLKKMGTAQLGKGGRGKLKALEDAGFIIKIKPFFHKRKGIYYKVIDEYTLFYFSWIEPVRETLLERGLRKGYWEKQQASASWLCWAGYAFEMICYKHLSQLADALNLSPAAIPTTWRYVPLKGSKEMGAQIDLLFDRDDDTILICEIKCTTRPFVIDKKYAHNLLNKVAVFKSKTGTKKQIFIAMISVNGLKTTMYSEELISAAVKLDDLFKE